MIEVRLVTLWKSVESPQGVSDLSLFEVIGWVELIHNRQSKEEKETYFQGLLWSELP